MYPDMTTSADSILFLGDVVLNRPYDLGALNHQNIIYNMEGPIGSGMIPRRHTWNLYVPTCYIKETFAVLPKAVSLANNHIMDFGLQALEATKSLLDDLGICYFGVGKYSDQFSNTLTLKIGNCSVGVLGYAAFDVGAQHGDESVAGAAPLEVGQIEKDIMQLKDKGVQKVIVYPHWGVEHVGVPTAETVMLAHKIIELGADLIVGNHSHTVQACELYKGKWIFYGLGNYIFEDTILNGFYTEGGLPTKQSRVVSLEHQKRSLGVEYFPETGTIRRHFFRCDKAKVRKIDGNLEDITHMTKNIDQYRKVYRSRYIREITAYRVISFLYNPQPSRILRFIRQHVFGG
jgi:hypothetical protein